MVLFKWTIGLFHMLSMLQDIRSGPGTTRSITTRKESARC